MNNKNNINKKNNMNLDKSLLRKKNINCVIIQARYNSSRLPGKVLKKLFDKTVLGHLVERLRQAKLVHQIVVATTYNPCDRAIVDWCTQNKVAYFCGSENDVLDRYYQTVITSSANTIVRLTGDCPLVDPYILDTMLSYFEEENYDYYYFVGPRGFPDGFEVEIMKKFVLKYMWYNVKDKQYREHVTLFLRDQPNNFRIGVYNPEINWSQFPHLRKDELLLSLDTPRDLKIIKYIYQNIYQNQCSNKHNNRHFELSDVLQFLENNWQNPEISNLIHYNKETVNMLQGKGQDLYKEAKTMIPGGTQLLSKRPELFLPDCWPAYYQKAEGITVTTLDGIKMKDFSYMGIGACVLGYQDPDVNRAVMNCVCSGNMCTLNHPGEVKLAKLLCQIHHWADMVRYARTGGEACAMAIRIARASSGKDRVAFCGYHGWHDWYLAANLDADNLNGHLIGGLDSVGVPMGLKGTAIPFAYNKIEELEKIMNTYSDVGTIIMEVQRGQPPRDNFLQKVRDIATKYNCVLIFDEITSGFRINTGGLHLIYGVNPDIAIFAKGISNGYPMAAVLGRQRVMSAVQDTFISSTYWTEGIGVVAAIATIQKFIKDNVGLKLQYLGDYFQTRLMEIISNNGIKSKITGWDENNVYIEDSLLITPLTSFAFTYPEGNKNENENKKESKYNKYTNKAIKTLYIQKMLQRRILATTSLYLSLAHTREDIDYYLENIKQVFQEMIPIIEKGHNEIVNNLVGGIAHYGFTRLT